MANNPNKALPDYDKPPVNEVVCGIQFQPLKAMTMPYLGVLWQKFRLDYPKCREVAPLVPAIERFDEQPAEDLNPFGDTFPSPRIWFETADGNGLIQVQRDRFLHNWKKERVDDEYPHFKHVITRFQECLMTFEQFLQENKLEEILPTQYELTYTNHIDVGFGWRDLSEIGSVFPDFNWRASEQRFLPVAEAINWQTIFTLPERAGRLRVSMRSAKRRSDGRPTILLELTARGITSESSRAAMWSWFDLAHKWIVCGFTDLTSDMMHKEIWRRKR
jgi:uncharacterized protein (TIGR04255 family)